jgi:hypothetical protein
LIFAVDRFGGVAQLSTLGIIMLFVIFHSTLLFLLFSPLYAEMCRDEWDDAQTEARITRASRKFFWSGVVAFCICAIFDVIVWRGFTVSDWLFVGFLGLFSLWQFGIYYWCCIRKKKDTSHDA